MSDETAIVGEDRPDSANTIQEQAGADHQDDAGRGDPVGGATRDYASAEFETLSSEPSSPVADGSLDTILDIPVTLSMEIGRTKISIRNLLQLNQGSVVELDRVAGEHLDVKVNGTLVAHGEVVVVNEKFGIRLTDVISAQERVKKLR